MPKSLVKEEKSSTDKYALFVAEPFEAGYGHTIGNSLRRVLLSSLEGAAITSVKIEGVLHEFSTLPHVVEDVVDIILNLKKSSLRPMTMSPALSSSLPTRRVSSLLAIFRARPSARL